MAFFSTVMSLVGYIRGALKKICKFYPNFKNLKSFAYIII